ncbi:hypothetical protein F9B85_10545 [Heliorestis acidaminivorans]|uniref:PKD domain-containing protein n=1 Tax=Heliorestis acidaminivorans TaxID=553427 RepID=A0A6I0ER83_9FIRM|nr:hypothetical protein [Heliorestis acidaminivorans]KAB2951986.1 hypothetical protein F9B85_10545 [Heliorestis acidaminivorans]
MSPSKKSIITFISRLLILFLLIGMLPLQIVEAAGGYDPQLQGFPESWTFSWPEKQNGGFYLSNKKGKIITVPPNRFPHDFEVHHTLIEIPANRQYESGGVRRVDINGLQYPGYNNDKAYVLNLNEVGKIADAGYAIIPLVDVKVWSKRLGGNPEYVYSRITSNEAYVMSINGVKCVNFSLVYALSGAKAGKPWDWVQFRVLDHLTTPLPTGNLTFVQGGPQVKVGEAVQLRFDVNATNGGVNVGYLEVKASSSPNTKAMVTDKKDGPFTTSKSGLTSVFKWNQPGHYEVRLHVTDGVRRNNKGIDSTEWWHGDQGWKDSFDYIVKVAQIVVVDPSQPPTTDDIKKPTITPDPPKLVCNPIATFLPTQSQVDLGGFENFTNTTQEDNIMIVKSKWRVLDPTGKEVYNSDHTGKADFYFDGFKISGIYQVNLSVMADCGAWSTERKGTVTVRPPPNYPPTALLEYKTGNGDLPKEGQWLAIVDKSFHQGEDFGEKITRWKWNIESGEPGNFESENDFKSGGDKVVRWMTPGTYNVMLTVEDQDGETSTTTLQVPVATAEPIANIKTSRDFLIVNRPIDITDEGSRAFGNRYINDSLNKWELIRPNGTVAWTGIQKEPPTNGEPINPYFYEEGIWKIRLQVTDNEGLVSRWAEKNIQVKSEAMPVADFFVDNHALRASVEDYTVKVIDGSYVKGTDLASGDDIVKRVWTLFYDSNGDGMYDQTILANEKTDYAQLITKNDNDTAPSIRFKHVGKYKLHLKVYKGYEYNGVLYSETFTHIGRDGVKRTVTVPVANTDEKNIDKSVIDVDNLPPYVSFELEKKPEKIEMVFLQAGLNQNQKETLAQANTDLRLALSKLGMNKYSSESKEMGISGEFYGQWPWGNISIEYIAFNDKVDGLVLLVGRDAVASAARIAILLPNGTWKTSSIPLENGEEYERLNFAGMFSNGNMVIGIARYAHDHYWGNHRHGYQRLIFLNSNGTVLKNLSHAGSWASFLGRSNKFHQLVSIDQEITLLEIRSDSVYRKSFDSAGNIIVNTTLYNTWHGVGLYPIEEKYGSHYVYNTYSYQMDKAAFHENARLTHYAEFSDGSFLGIDTYLFYTNSVKLKYFKSTSTSPWANKEWYHNERIIEYHSSDADTALPPNFFNWRTLTIRNDSNILYTPYNWPTGTYYKVAADLKTRKVEKTIESWPFEGKTIKNVTQGRKRVAMNGEQGEYWTFVEDLNTRSLLDELQKLSFSQEANKYVVLSTDKQIREEDNVTFQNIRLFLETNKIQLFLIGSPEVVPKWLYLPSGGFQVNSNNDMRIPMGEISEHILSFFEQKNTRFDTVLVYQPLHFKVNENDPEHDPLDPSSGREWLFEHLPNKIDLELYPSYSKGIVENHLGIDSSLHNKTLVMPPRWFTKPGWYNIKYRVKDLPGLQNTPPTQSNLIDHYSKWSNETGGTVLVLRPPVADFEVRSIDGTAISHGKPITIIDKSESIDIRSRPNKGIVQYEWRIQFNKLPNGNKISNWHTHPSLQQVLQESEEGALWLTSIPPSLPYPGEWTFRLRVMNEFGYWSTWTMNKVIVKNDPPVARFTTSHYPAIVGQAVQFIDQSIDPNGDKVTRWHWEIPSNGSGNITHTTQNPIFSFTTAGVYEIKLCVIDVYGDPNIVDHWGCTTMTLPVTPPIEKPKARFNVQSIIGSNVVMVTQPYWTVDQSEAFQPLGSPISNKVERWYWELLSPSGQLIDNWLIIRSDLSSPAASSGQFPIGPNPIWPKINMPSEKPYKLRLRVEDSWDLSSEWFEQSLMVIAPLDFAKEPVVSPQPALAGERIKVSLQSEGYATHAWVLVPYNMVVEEGKMLPPSKGKEQTPAPTETINSIGYVPIPLTKATTLPHEYPSVNNIPFMRKWDGEFIVNVWTKDGKYPIYYRIARQEPPGFAPETKMTPARDFEIKYSVYDLVKPRRVVNPKE